jgi:hypothetical protein
VTASGDPVGEEKSSSLPRPCTLLAVLWRAHRKSESPRRIRYDAVTPSQGDAALRMLALGCLEDGAGELCVRSASKDALDSIAATIVPQLHSVGELLLWGGSPVTLQDFVLALHHTLERTGATARHSMLRRVRTGYDIILVA